MIFSVIVVILLSSVLPNDSVTTADSFECSKIELRDSIVVDNRNRPYFLHIPEKIKANAPLVFVLHGYGSSASSIMNYTKMNTIANENGFAVCYPQAFLGSDEKHSWNAGYSNFDVDDVKFLSRLATSLQEKYSLSPINTFSTGMSNGADMSYLLACQNPEMFRAIAPIAGCMMESTYADCNHIKPVSIFHVHGTDDDITYWKGDKEYLPGSGGYRSTTSTINYWSKKNGSSTVSIDTLQDLNTEDNSIVIREKRTNPITGKRTWLYTIKGGKHDWPGESGNKDFSTSEEIWNFFESELINSKRTNISFFGSSVCKGSGAKDTKGYAYQFYNNNVIDTLIFDYYNASTGGDNTLKVEQEKRLTAKLYPTDPDIVVIGLSLGNEGIRTPQTENGRLMILEQYRSRLLALADSLNGQGILPVIANCYAHSYFTEAQYESTKRMNQIINTWPYPSINLLGTIDNGEGKWVEGYVNDPWHPNTKGHHEMSLAIVPSLFEAIQMGKRTPSYDYNNSYASLINDSNLDAITYEVEHLMHSFTMGFRFKNASNGIIATITTNKGERTVKIIDHRISYMGHEITFPKHIGDWNHVVISHNHANQKTMFAINGQVVAEVDEQLIPSKFVFGGTLNHVDLKDLTLHRSSLHKEEIRDVNNKLFIQSSLEIYTPLTIEAHGTHFENKAQSLSQLSINENIELNFENTPYYKKR